MGRCPAKKLKWGQGRSKISEWARRRRAGPTGAALARAIRGVAAKARGGTITPDELAGGTYTLSNSGTFGTLITAPIINQPQVAILAVGAIKKRPVVIETEQGDSIAIRHMMYLSLTYDHRLVDGADAGRFLTTLRQRLEGGEFANELGL